MRVYDLRRDCDPQQYGLGIKEVWEVPEDHPEFAPGLPGFIDTSHSRTTFPLPSSAMCIPP